MATLHTPNGLMALQSPIASLNKRLADHQIYLKVMALQSPIASISMTYWASKFIWKIKPGHQHP
jgi:hypothetical protein